jgi:hypothetical protein
LLETPESGHGSDGLMDHSPDANERPPHEVIEVQILPQVRENIYYKDVKLFRRECKEKSLIKSVEVAQACRDNLRAGR